MNERNEARQKQKWWV